MDLGSVANHRISWTSLGVHTSYIWAGEFQFLVLWAMKQDINHTNYIIGRSR